MEKAEKTTRLYDRILNEMAPEKIWHKGVCIATLIILIVHMTILIIYPEKMSEIIGKDMLTLLMTAIICSRCFTVENRRNKYIFYPLGIILLVLSLFLKADFLIPVGICFIFLAMIMFGIKDYYDSRE